MRDLFSPFHMVCETTEKNEIKLKYLTLVHEAYAFQNKGCV